MKERILTGVTVNHIWKTFNGFTLFAPLGSRQARLIDMGGDTVNTWDLGGTPALYVELLPSGNLLAAVKDENGPMADMEGAGGRIVELDWDGKEIWKYEDPMLHHAFCRLSNGNTLVLKWEKVDDALAAKVKGGVEGSERGGDMFADVVAEIDAQGNEVWSWKAAEHLDPETDTICPLCERDEWTCANSVSTFENGNVLLSFKRMNMVCVVNRRSGAVEYRWGQREIGHQNGATVIENQHILLFDNGLHAEGIHHPFSRVIELDPTTNKMVWNYRDEDNDNVIFYSCFMSGCQRLPNGNTLITESNYGRIFEVHRKGEIVWEYVNPDFVKVPEYGTNNVVPRAQRYGLDYPGLKGVKDLGLGAIIQTEAAVQRNKAAKAERDGADGGKDDSDGAGAVMSRLENLGY